MSIDDSTDKFLKVETQINVKEGLWNSFILCYLEMDKSSKITKIRLSNPLVKQENWNLYSFYFRLPNGFKNGNLVLEYQSNSNFKANMKSLDIFILSAK